MGKKEIPYPPHEKRIDYAEKNCQIKQGKK
jgi:hypothetical protein